MDVVVEGGGQALQAGVEGAPRSSVGRYSRNRAAIASASTWSKSAKPRLAKIGRDRNRYPLGRIDQGEGPARSIRAIRERPPRPTVQERGNVRRRPARAPGILPVAASA